MVAKPATKHRASRVVAEIITRGGGDRRSGGDQVVVMMKVSGELFASFFQMNLAAQFLWVMAYSNVPRVDRLADTSWLRVPFVSDSSWLGAAAPAREDNWEHMVAEVVFSP